MRRVIDQIQQREQAEGMQLLSPNVKVKITGDGTCIGKHYVVNVCFSITLVGGKVSRNHIAAVLRVNEKYDQLKRTLSPLLSDCQNVTDITVNDKTYSIEYFLAADMKFLNIILGLQACSAKYFCAWRKCPSDKVGICP